MYDMGMEMGISPTRAAIRDYVCMCCNAKDVDIADDFDTVLARHICVGSKNIVLLNRTYVPVPTTKGVLNVELFLCQKCRKVILNKSTME